MGTIAALVSIACAVCSFCITRSLFREYRQLRKWQAHSNKEVVVSNSAPSYAGVCTSCKCAFDRNLQRIRVLDDAQFQQFKCRGLCFTCKTVKAEVIKANTGWQGGVL